MHSQEISKKTDQSHSSNSLMDECIQNCLNCYQICEQTLVSSFSSLKKSDSSHLKLLKSCSDICNLSARFMIMETTFHVDTCGLCAKICQECADKCEEAGDPSMKECIDICRKCAESCSQMSQMSH